jgi:hypothetical protein
MCTQQASVHVAAQALTLRSLASGIGAEEQAARTRIAIADNRVAHYGHMNAIGGHTRGVIASGGGVSPSQIEVGRPAIVMLPCP